jgi:HK97 gp10 family phage protein
MFDFGLEEKDLEVLKQRLNSMPIYINKQVHLSALRAAALPIYSELDHTTPYQFGHLVSDLRIRNSKFQEHNEHTVIVGYKGGTGHVGYVGRFLEYGTVHIAARGFMRKAEENNRIAVQTIYVNKIQHEVDKLLK